MKKLFVNTTENRLRSGWRIVIFYILFFTVFGTAGILMQKFIPIRLVRSLTGFVVISSVILGASWLAARYLDRRKFKDYGLQLSREWWQDFVFGFLLSAVLLLITFVIEKTMGWINVIGFFQNQREGYIGLPFWIPFFLGIMFYMVVGVYEELLFRGYLIKNLAEGFHGKKSTPKGSIIYAVIGSSVIFGLFHSGNANASFVGIVNLVLFGVLFSLPYILSGRLGLSIGFHISWNLVQGLVLGFPVSGEVDKLSVIAIEQGGPALLTGGNFGPEGGFVCSIMCIIGFLAVIVWYRMCKCAVAFKENIVIYHSNKS